MDLFKKFVIEDGPEDGMYMVVAKCTYHKQLAFNIDNIKGGGMWEANDEYKQITLFGTSDQFGDCSLIDIMECVNNGKVFSSYTLSNNLLENFSFKYKYLDGKIIEL